MKVVSKYPESFHRESCLEVDPVFGDPAMESTWTMPHVTHCRMEYSIFPTFPLPRRRDKMPATYEIDKQRRLVISTGLDKLTLADALAHQAKLLKDPDFDPSFSQLLDLTRVTLSDLESSDIRKIAERNIFSPQSRRAIVVSTNLVYGYGRMFEILRESAGEDGIRVFRDLDEAVDWILSESTTP
jgi:hypothetical protein